MRAVHFACICQCFSYLSVQSEKSTERVQAESQTGKINVLICSLKISYFRTIVDLGKETLMFSKWSIVPCCVVVSSAKRSRSCD